jgi:hypothetical protein
VSERKVGLWKELETSKVIQLVRSSTDLERGLNAQEMSLAYSQSQRSIVPYLWVIGLGQGVTLSRDSMY